MMARLLVATLVALLTTGAALRVPVTPLAASTTLQLRHRIGIVQLGLVDGSWVEDEDGEASEVAAASPAAAGTGAEPETVVVDFGSPFGDKSSPIWQKPKPVDSSGDKETPAALKLVLDYLCKSPMLERLVGVMVGRSRVCGSADLTFALCPRRGAFRAGGGSVGVAMRPIVLVFLGLHSSAGLTVSFLKAFKSGAFKSVQGFRKLRRFQKYIFKVRSTSSLRYIAHFFSR